MHPTDDASDLQALFSDHHRTLESICRDMVAWAATDVPHARSTRWNVIRAELLDHLAAEEEVILPEYARSAPEDADQITADHSRIRGLVDAVDEDVVRNEIRRSHINPLVEAIAAHVRAEQSAMYPWAAQNLALVAQRLLFARIGKSMERE